MKHQVRWVFRHTVNFWLLSIEWNFRIYSLFFSFSFVFFDGNTNWTLPHGHFFSWHAFRSWTSWWSVKWSRTCWAEQCRLLTMARPTKLIRLSLKSQLKNAIKYREQLEIAKIREIRWNSWENQVTSSLCQVKLRLKFNYCLNSGNFGWNWVWFKQKIDYLKLQLIKNVSF